MTLTQKTVEVIPQTMPLTAMRIKAAVYCRVSNKSEDLENSLENQLSHYEDAVGNDPRYDLVEIYYDFGISGFKEKRPGFQRMMADAEEGKFELIITKAITRFARNTDTVLKATRRLKELGIGVYFEVQGINTLSQAGELLMTLYAAFGQAESEGARMHGLMQIKRRMEDGRPPQQLQKCLGYSKNTDGEFIPNEYAPLVLEIYEMAAEGFTPGQITNYLNDSGVKTQNGKKFCRSTVTRILRNVAYKGDFICQQYFINDERKRMVNRGEKPMYYIEGDHIPIVTSQLWEDVQKKLDGQSRKAVPTESRPLELNDENYPYRKKLYCAKCGYPLQRAVRAGRVLWECTGQARFSKGFCSGVSIDDDTVQSWLPIKEPIYITETADRGRITGYEYEVGDNWNKEHSKKRYVPDVPELNEDNYPYMNRIYCKRCGSRLRRYIGKQDKVFWICDEMSRHGTSACKGVRIPDEKLQPLQAVEGNVYIGKETINGKENYGYSRKPDKREK